MITYRCEHCGTISNALVHCFVRDDRTRIEAGRLFTAQHEIEAFTPAMERTYERWMAFMRERHIGEIER